MSQTANSQKSEPVSLAKNHEENTALTSLTANLQKRKPVSLTKNHEGNTAPTALKGRKTLAQGNALGMTMKGDPSPERATDQSFLSPFQDLPDDEIADQGQRFASPLACRPFRAFFPKLSLTILFLLALSLLALAQMPNFGDVSVKVEAMHTSDVGEGYGEYRATITNYSTKQSHKVVVVLPSYGYDNSVVGIKEVRRTIELAPQSTATLALLSPSLSTYTGTAEIIIDGEKQKEGVPISFERLGATRGRSNVSSILLSPSISKSNLFATANIEQALKKSSGELEIATQAYEFPMSEWSQNWMSFTRFNGVMLQAEELNAAPETVRSALLRYVERGGTLIVTGTWRPPVQWQAWRGSIKDEPVISKEDEAVTEPAPKPTPNSRPQAELPVFYIGFGSVFVTESIDPKEISVNQWNQMKERLTGKRLGPEEYATLATINQEFRVVEQFGVPVRGLFALMLLFVIVIGPVNLLWLAKKKRKIWMLWTIPAISLLTCLIVAGYSLFGEGWNATARTEALTILDETAHRATTIGWTGFYSPITPSDGLHFGYDTEVIPQLPSSWDYRRRFSERTLDWTNDQHLTAGWVTARVPAFFKLRKTEARRERLNIRQTRNDVTLVNGLGAEIEKLWWADANGILYSAENISAGAQAKLQATQMKASGTASSLREAYTGNWLENFQAFGNKPQTVLMPNSYLAVLKGAPFVEEGLKNVKTRSERNLVYGVGGER